MLVNGFVIACVVKVFYSVCGGHGEVFVRALHCEGETYHHNAKNTMVMRRVVWRCSV